MEETLLPMINSRALLLSNRQVSEELQGVFARDGATGKLDCMVSKGFLWPTWTLLTPSLKYLRSVGVDLRVFDSRLCHWRRYHGCPGRLVCRLLRILGWFFEYGHRFYGELVQHPVYLQNGDIRLIWLPVGPVKKWR